MSNATQGARSVTMVRVKEGAHSPDLPPPTSCYHGWDPPGPGTLVDQQEITVKFLFGPIKPSATAPRPRAPKF
jgi:hypothetical protein